MILSIFFVGSFLLSNFNVHVSAANAEEAGAWEENKKLKILNDELTQLLNTLKKQTGPRPSVYYSESSERTLLIGGEEVDSSRDDGGSSYDGGNSAGAHIATRPNIVFFLVDDFGWANIGYHKPEDNNEVTTPTLDKLASKGVKLDRFYAYNQCGPSRSSLHTGRLVNHVNSKNSGYTAYNESDPINGYGAVPPKMTMMGTKLRDAGYKTAFTGKWDVGMVSVLQMPYHKGYDKFLGYLQHANSYCSSHSTLLANGLDVCQSRFLDFWEMDEDGYRPFKFAGQSYEEKYFLEHSLNIINQHDPEKDPLFLFHASHLIHSPLQVPEPWVQNFSHIEIKGNSDHDRRQYAAMVQYMDHQVEQIVDALKAKGMWENTLFVFHSDNGGPTYTTAAANNFPHRGGKKSDFEGGIRVNAFVSGGAIPEAAQGTTSTEKIHISDWYTTFCALAGADPTDEEAAKVGLPPVDGKDMWPAIIGEGKGHDEIYISNRTIIMGDYKLITGKVPFDMYTGPLYPNNTCQPCTESGDRCADCRQPGINSGWWLPCTPAEREEGTCHAYRDLDAPSGSLGYPSEFEHMGGWVTDCSKLDKIGCLFNIMEDPEERNDLGEDARYIDLGYKMLARLNEYRETNYNPGRGGESYLSCIAGFHYGGFSGPYINEDHGPLFPPNSNFHASPSCDACEVKPIGGGEEYCVLYPDYINGFTCTPFINGKCAETENFIKPKGVNAPIDAKFLCGSKQRSWAVDYDLGTEVEFSFKETAKEDRITMFAWKSGPVSDEYPFPNICPANDIAQSSNPVHVRRRN